MYLLIVVIEALDNWWNFCPAMCVNGVALKKTFVSKCVSYSWLCNASEERVYFYVMIM